MRAIQHSFILFFVLFVISCATTLPIDTLNKRIAAFEIGYTEVLKNVNLWIDEGILVDQPKINAQTHIREISIARKAMYLAMGAGNLSTASGRLSAMSTTLGLIRGIIAKQEK